MLRKASFLYDEPNFLLQREVSEISQAAATVCIKLLDHIIAAGDSYYSFMEKGIMPEQGIDFTKSRINRNDFDVEEGEEMEI